MNAVSNFVKVYIRYHGDIDKNIFTQIFDEYKTDWYNYLTGTTTLDDMRSNGLLDREDVEIITL